MQGHTGKRTPVGKILQSLTGNQQRRHRELASEGYLPKNLDANSGVFLRGWEERTKSRWWKEWSIGYKTKSLRHPLEHEACHSERRCATGGLLL
ncbi:hypothetical protein AVEN_220016-1 [Araneus ventricosus]|uniref:Uncharacterized protein n=1 Tax=Araneus ventricosus TaxID=182803 RepID=A0A4Y2CR23_ARAVE|nr:hypothetical protein AVEN_220016-1 [Araneus ventricosus]